MRDDDLDDDDINDWLFDNRQTYGGWPALASSTFGLCVLIMGHVLMI